MSQDLQLSIEKAVRQAKSAYDDENKLPVDHGYAHVGGADDLTVFGNET
jgi:hypothetical protein